MSDPSESAVPDADQRAAALRIVSRNIGDEEAAAVTAVILASVDEAAAAAASVDEPGRAPWLRSSGALRRPIEVGPGRWVRSGR